MITKRVHKEGWKFILEDTHIMKISNSQNTKIHTCMAVSQCKDGT